MALSHDQRRTLRLLADAPNGATATIILARGCTISLLDDLVLRGLATTEKRATRDGAAADQGHPMPGGRRMHDGWRRSVSFRLQTCCGTGPGRQRAHFRDPAPRHFIR
jgi:hypothetical protein